MVTGFTGSIEPTMWVRSNLIRSSVVIRTDGENSVLVELAWICVGYVVCRRIKQIGRTHDVLLVGQGHRVRQEKGAERCRPTLLPSLPAGPGSPQAGRRVGLIASVRSRLWLTGGTRAGDGALPRFTC